MAQDSAPQTCSCGSGQVPEWEHDARGIPLERVCGRCREGKLAKYRRDVLTNPSYEADEDIEPEWAPEWSL